jgi:hypothetical protein
MSSGILAARTVAPNFTLLYNEVLPEFHKHGAELLEISVDGVWCHAAFARDRQLHFPRLADFEPKGDVAKKYRADRASEGVCERAVRPRSAGHHCMDLFVSDRGQPRRGWNSRRSRKALKSGKRTWPL